jgi:hypothetical protein
MDSLLNAVLYTNTVEQGGSMARLLGILLKGKSHQMLDYI